MTYFIEPQISPLTSYLLLLNTFFRLLACKDKKKILSLRLISNVFFNMISKSQIKLVRQLEQKKYRTRLGLFVAEGPKVVGDLMLRQQPRLVFATDEWSGWQQLTEGGKTPECFRVSNDELQRVSFLQHPQQVLAVFPLPDTSEELLKPDARRLILALDGVQDPGNLGTIIRIADWFGIDAICCSLDTADAWSPKVVQATMGSLAHVHIVYTDLAAWIDRRPPEVPVYGTLLDGDDLYRQKLTTGGIIVMGNEGRGLSATIRERVTSRLLIPCFRQGPAAESLNVAIATAITCSEFRRRS